MSDTPASKPPPKPAPPAAAPAPSGEEIVPGVRIADSAMRFQFARSSGPGGQNVNKLNTKAELWVPLTAISGLSDRAVGRLRALAGRRLTGAGEIHITSETERSQEGNKSAVLDRLRRLLTDAQHEPKARRRTKPSRAAKRRRLDSKRRRSEVKSNRRAGFKDS